jgi:hypothetical protein
MMRRARRVRSKGFIAYDGTHEKICKAIIEDTYDKKHKYFRVSPAKSGHFCEFYMRDFGLCCEALQELGYTAEVRLTIEYALHHYSKAGKITTAINPKQEPFDYFLPTGPDTLAFLLYSITHTKNHDLAKMQKKFLQKQVDLFAKKFVDKRTLLPKNKHVSSIRDQTRRKGSCYDAIMIAIVAREATTLKLEFPYSLDRIKAAILKEYWNGTYFFQDKNKQDIVVADANIFPFWSGIFNDTKMLEQTIDAIRAAELDVPFPIKYVSPADKKREKTSFHIVSIFSSDYETDSIWMHLGLAYLRVIQFYNPKLLQDYLAAYNNNLQKYKTFLELYDKDGKPFMRRWYASDEGMLWCANYLVLQKYSEESSEIREVKD